MVPNYPYIFLTGEIIVLKKKGIARREFLTSIGRVAGSSAMLRAMAAMGISISTSSCGSSSAGGGSPSVSGQSLTTNSSSTSSNSPALKSPRPGDWQNNIGSGKSVVILGAGIAGMTTAYEMKKLGYSCTILEATNRAGGRNRTIRSGDTIVETDSNQTCLFDVDDDLYFNPGPARISHHHEFLITYCREFNVALETFVNDNRAALIHSTSSFGGQPQIARSILADSRGHIGRLLSFAVNQNALDQELSATDKTQILQMLTRFGDLGSNYTYTGSSRAGFPGQEDKGSRQRDESLTPRQIQELISEPIWQARLDFFHGLNQQATMLQPVGGMDRIADAFKNQVGSDIQYESIVKEIRKIVNGVRVVYEKSSILTSLEVDYCVCTIPAPVLKDIPNDFSSEFQQEISNFGYSSAGKLAFQSKRFWEKDHNIYGGISWTDQDITQIWYPSFGFGKSKGILVGAYIWGATAANSFANQTPQQRITAAMTQGSILHSEYTSEVTHGISVSWLKVPYQMGAYGYSTPNVLLNPDDNIFFAGEHLSILQGWQEGAILSAYNAIDGIVKKDIG